MASSASTPADRNVAQEGRETLQAQVDLAPDIYAARAKYDPLYADLSVENLRRSLMGTDGKPGLLQTYADIEPQLTEFAARSQSGQRERDVADVERLGARATDALRMADPTAAGLEDQLAAQASAGLSAGAGLDPAMRDEVQQSVRAAQAARGFGFGGSDADVEGLFLGREANQMLQQRRQFASQVAAQRRATTGDPFMAILGRPSQTGALAQGVMNQASGTTAGAQQFDPWNAYASDVYNTNYNAKAAANIANANNQTAITAAGISAAGSAAGSL